MISINIVQFAASQILIEEFYLWLLLLRVLLSHGPILQTFYDH